MNKEMVFSLNISADAYIQYYQGKVKHVVVRAWGGKTIQFSAGLLREFVTHEGVRGNFVIRFDENNKLIGMQRVV